MANNRKKALEDDDLDMATADEGDLADETWDEYDEEAVKAANQEPASPVRAPRKKSGGLFNAVVIIIIGLAGGAYFFGKYLFPPPASQSPAAVETAQDPLSGGSPGEGAPPMPSPIQAALEPTTETSGDLTPMPGQAPAEQTAGVTEEMGVSEPESSSPAAEEIAGSLVPRISAQVTENPPAPAEQGPGEIQQIQAQEISETPLENPATVSESINVNSMPDASAPSEEPAPQPQEPESQPAVPQEMAQTNGSVPASSGSEGAELLSAKVTALEENLAQMMAANSALEEQVVSANQKIASLQEGMIAMLRKLDAMTVAGSAAANQAPRQASGSSVQPLIPAAPQEPGSPAPASSAPPAVKAPAVPAAAKPASPARAQAAPGEGFQRPVTALASGAGSRWELRSAQPGKAVVSPKGSNEMRTVAVGDTLEGLGRITSIDLQGSIWTVTGTRGQLFR